MSSETLVAPKCTRKGFLLAVSVAVKLQMAFLAELVAALAFKKLIVSESVRP